MTTKKHYCSLFLFHRDLRLEDNTGLIKALEESQQVIPAFILDPDQISQKNPYRGDHALEFMQACLKELDVELRKKGSQLYVFVGKTSDILPELFKLKKIDAFYSNRDYTPFPRKRDQFIGELCEKMAIDFSLFNDALLTEPEAVYKQDGKPYTVFTPFFRKAAILSVPKPQKNPYSNYFQEKISLTQDDWEKAIHFKSNPHLRLKGGRVEGLHQLDQLGALINYSVIRDQPENEKGTSLLSAHHKFGTISIRETYHFALQALGPEHMLFSELYWRDFFTHIAFHFPHVFGHAFHKKYDGIKWIQDKILFKKWCEGQTGFPIVDAGMRQLNQTGYMHNRVRMITASFLVKDLHIDWCWGERYFAQKLIDYDPAINNGNWQWAASTGCDAQPYFRIFNPWRQQERFDPESKYIKRWIPELEHLESKVLNQWHENEGMNFESYPFPIVGHAEERDVAKLMYKDCK